MTFLARLDVRAQDPVTATRQRTGGCAAVRRGPVTVIAVLVPLIAFAQVRPDRAVAAACAGADVHAAIGVVPIAVIAFLIALGTLGEIGAQDAAPQRAATHWLVQASVFESLPSSQAS